MEYLANPILERSRTLPATRCGRFSQGRIRNMSARGQIQSSWSQPDDVPPRRLTLRFLTQPPRRRGWARRSYNSLQVLRHAHRDHQLTIGGWPNTDVSVLAPGNSSWPKLTSVARETPSSNGGSVVTKA